MNHMKRASVRDLRYDFRSVERLLSEGEPIEITKRRKVIAKLIPSAGKTPVRMPDFASRMAEVYGKKKLPAGGAALVRWDRDRGN